MDTTFFASSSKLVNSGKVPYKDFFFCQFPVAPYFYGILQNILGFNLYSLRSINALLGLIILLLCIVMAHRGSGYSGALTFAFLYSFNSFNIYNYSIGKMYSMVAFFLVVGVFFLTTKIKPILKNTLALSFIALSLASRLTILPFYVFMVLYVYVDNRKSKKDYIIPVLISLILLLAIFMPLLVLAKGQIYHDVFGLHVGQEKGPFDFGIKNRLMALFQTFRFYFFPVVLIPLIFVPLKNVYQCQHDEPINKPLFVLFVWLGLFSTMLGHFTVNWFTPAYQTMTFPVFALMLSIRYGLFVENLHREDLKKIAILFLAIGSILMTVSYGKTSIWMHLGKPAYQYLKDVNDFLVTRTETGDKILAFSSVVVVNANRELAKGTEAFPFTFTPSWDIKKCLNYKTVNVDILESYFQSGEIKALVIDKDSFDIQFPGFYPTGEKDKQRIWNSINQYYFIAGTIPQFGSEFNDLLLYLLKTENR